MSVVFVVEPYFTGSHRAWAEGYQKHSEHQVYLLTLPGRFWKWRMFGGTLTLAQQAVDLVGKVGTPDTLLVSDMLDLPSFLGHAGEVLGNPGTVLFMHENQLTYPPSPTAAADLSYAYLNWSSMVRANEVWFNSRYHFDSVFDALPGFLGHFPDHRHTAMVDRVREKSEVVPVGVDLGWLQKHEKGDPPLIIWNQRWEHDKDPDRLFRALYRLADSGAEFRLAICGENFRNVPVEFEKAKDRLAKQLVHYGYAERAEYEGLLLDASVVVSTARHEFFGVGAVEAMAAGGLPVLPDGLSYPELLPSNVHRDTLYRSEDQLDELLNSAITDAERRHRLSSATASAMEAFSWETLSQKYDKGLAFTP